MSDPLPDRFGTAPSRAMPAPYGSGSSANLADILERVLDKGIVIAGDIRINLLDIELLTIKLRILVASVDKAKEMGIDWWEHDPSLSSKHSGGPLAEENRRLRAELDALRRAAPIANEPRIPGTEQAVETEAVEPDDYEEAGGGYEEPGEQQGDPSSTSRRKAARRRPGT
ncbi:putative gas vesicle synthesis protein [Streptomyces venezuelae ATCC 10712]|uniref:Putative gas vesicle synthesis protein n=2 Tax=Streptomyces TaxID=1883 RepID=F2RJ15_STRVP|nr:putative gas vesicle synthesis protein [Streptomyces venezuelae ATCC 10712]